MLHALAPFPHAFFTSLLTALPLTPSSHAHPLAFPETSIKCLWSLRLFPLPETLLFQIP